MATIKAYARNLWNVHKIVSQKLGTDIRWGSSEARVAALTNDVCLAGIVKILTDKGLITDAELQAVFTTITNADFPRQPAIINAPGEDGVIADPDLGV